MKIHFFRSVQHSVLMGKTGNFWTAKAASEQDICKNRIISAFDTKIAPVAKVFYSHGDRVVPFREQSKHLKCAFTISRFAGIPVWVRN